MAAEKWQVRRRQWRRSQRKLRRRWQLWQGRWPFVGRSPNSLRGGGRPSGGPHLAIFLRCLMAGGAERAMVRLANGLAQRGWSVDVVLAEADGPFVTLLDPAVRVINFDCSLWGSFIPLVQYLRRERPAVLLGILHYPAELAIVAKYLSASGVRVVVSERNTLSREARQAREWTARQTPHMARLLYPLADRVLAVSDGVADDLARTAHLPRSRIETVYNFINFRAAGSPGQGSEPPHPWLEAGGIPTVVGVGRLMPQKDFGTFLRAVARVRARQPLRAIICGEGRDRASLEGLARELGIREMVDFLGFVRDPSAYVRHGAAFVLSSRWEGFPNVVLEALALGVPVVSTNYPHGPAEMLDRGRYGQLVPVGDDRAMAAAIETVLAGNAPRPTAAWLARFSEATLLDRYEQVLGLRELCGRRQRRLQPAVRELP